MLTPYLPAHSIQAMFTFIIHFIFYFSLVFVCITHTVFLVYLIKTDNTQHNIRPIHFLKAMALEVLSILLHIVFLPFSNLKLKAKLLPGKNAYPILLIPGFMENQTDWWFHTIILKYYGMSKIYTLNLTPMFASIETHTKIVHHEIQRIKQETNQSKVILLGHSRGGLVASHYTENFNQDDVAMVITIATPFYGSTLARYAFGKDAHQMLPNSAFLSALSDRIQHSAVPYRCIASRVDSLVFPWSACIPNIHHKNTVNSCIIQDTGHIGLLKNFQVSLQLRDWLTPT